MLFFVLLITFSFGSGLGELQKAEQGISYDDKVYMYEMESFLFKNSLFQHLILSPNIHLDLEFLECCNHGLVLSCIIKYDISTLVLEVGIHQFFHPRET